MRQGVTQAVDYGTCQENWSSSKQNYYLCLPSYISLQQADSTQRTKANQCVSTYYSFISSDGSHIVAEIFLNVMGLNLACNG